VFNRIQTVENLKKRNIVADGVNLNCVFCDATMETTNHLMFECNFSYYIWLNCYQWLSELRTLPNNCKCHFWQHIGSIKGKEEGVVGSLGCSYLGNMEDQE